MVEEAERRRHFSTDPDLVPPYVTGPWTETHLKQMKAMEDEHQASMDEADKIIAAIDAKTEAIKAAAAKEAKERKASLPYHLNLAKQTGIFNIIILFVKIFKRVFKEKKEAAMVKKKTTTPLVDKEPLVDPPLQVTTSPEQEHSFDVAAVVEESIGVALEETEKLHNKSSTIMKSIKDFFKELKEEALKEGGKKPGEEAAENIFKEFGEFVLDLEIEDSDKDRVFEEAQMDRKFLRN